MFETMIPPRPDSLMEIGALFRADPRDDKIDLGVGTYRDDYGSIRVMSAVKEAEGWHLKSQTGKGYLGPGGDRQFAALLMGELFPELPATSEGRLALIQAPGGTGAYRLGLELAAYRSPNSTLIVGTPTWPNHIPVADRVGLRCKTYRYYDPMRGEVDFAAMVAALTSSCPGDLFLIHGCCHNPTGAALTPTQWPILIAAIRDARVLPVVDLAYSGMAKGLEDDAAAARKILETLPEAIIAISCSKSFGLYSDRTGMLAVLASNAAAAESCRLTAETLARPLWSNPPNHGAAIVRTILSDEPLRIEWRAELERMRLRLAVVRKRLAASRLPGAAAFASQEGLFAMMPLAPDQIVALRLAHGIYIDETGRINIAGLNTGNLNRFIEACRAVTLGREQCRLRSIDALEG